MDLREERRERASRGDTEVLFWSLVSSFAQCVLPVVPLGQQMTLRHDECVISEISTVGASCSDGLFMSEMPA